MQILSLRTLADTCGFWAAQDLERSTRKAEQGGAGTLMKVTVECQRRSDRVIEFRSEGCLLYVNLSHSTHLLIETETTYETITVLFI
jgi:hypothetical protein